MTRSKQHTAAKRHKSLVSNHVRKSKHIVQQRESVGSVSVLKRVNADFGQKEIVQERQLVEQRVKLQLSGLSDETQQILRDNQYQNQVNQGAIVIDDVHADNEGLEADWQDEPMDEVIRHALRDISGSQWKGRWYRNSANWQSRKQRENTAWDALIEPLADRLLEWKKTDSETQQDSPATDERSATPMDSDECYEYTVSTYDLFSLQQQLTIFRPATSTSPALDLMAHGYIAKTPTQPDVAVSVGTLQLLYRLRQRKASFSIEAFTKVICDYYSVPFRRFLRNIIADTFEIFLRVTNTIERRVAKAFGRDSSDWRVKNACPACCYKLKSKPPLRFSRMFCVDGNNSLKRMATMGERVVADTRVFESSNYYLPPDFVDRFANEVRGKKGPSVKTKRRKRVESDEGGDSDSSDDEGDRQSIEGDPTDGARGEPQEANIEEAGPSVNSDNTQKALARQALAACVKNWKAASAEESKRMWSIFAECGIFASACRHGFILWLIDMVRSGEL
ncbi:hypothetical protein PHLCEN_2v4453 [Hermanssonia centrifuga]|uniref:CxC1-like cysteine cluster associated with KDZ transposases domain-containing protein n=1 Tax=Hermanssonia centrifuga TaxID=98765 RepID=A0A2R6PP92_9APHY|nr:hypothetical protein PHLCEN_2v4453 [Hermanssonia centrifuga]